MGFESSHTLSTWRGGDEISTHAHTDDDHSIFAHRVDILIPPFVGGNLLRVGVRVLEDTILVDVSGAAGSARASQHAST